jgi:hypothetical protein
MVKRFSIFLKLLVCLNLLFSLAKGKKFKTNYHPKSLQESFKAIRLESTNDSVTIAWESTNRGSKQTETLNTSLRETSILVTKHYFNNTKVETYQTSGLADDIYITENGLFELINKADGYFGKSEGDYFILKEIDSGKPDKKRAWKYKFDSGRILAVISGEQILARDPFNGISIYTPNFRKQLLDAGFGKLCDFRVRSLTNGFILVCFDESEDNNYINLYVFETVNYELVMYLLSFQDKNISMKNYKIIPLKDGKFIFLLGRRMYLYLGIVLINKFDLEFEKICKIDEEFIMNYEFKETSILYKVYRITTGEQILRQGEYNSENESVPFDKDTELFYAGQSRFFLSTMNNSGGGFNLEIIAINKLCEDITIYNKAVNTIEYINIPMIEESCKLQYKQCDGFILNTGESCILTCPQGYFPDPISGNCIKNELRTLTDCSAIQYYDQCVTECPILTAYDPTIKTCYRCQERNKVYHNKECLSSCPDGYFPDNLEKCIQCLDNEVYYDFKCLSECPVNTLQEQKMCVDTFEYTGNIYLI